MTNIQVYDVANRLMRVLMDSGYTNLEARTVLVAVGELISKGEKKNEYKKTNEESEFRL